MRSSVEERGEKAESGGSGHQKKRRKGEEEDESKKERDDRDRTKLMMVWRTSRGQRRGGEELERGHVQTDMSSRLRYPSKTCSTSPGRGSSQLDDAPVAWADELTRARTRAGRAM